MIDTLWHPKKSIRHDLDPKEIKLITHTLGKFKVNELSDMAYIQTINFHEGEFFCCLSSCERELEPDVNDFFYITDKVILINFSISLRDDNKPRELVVKHDDFNKFIRSLKILTFLY